MHSSHQLPAAAKRLLLRLCFPSLALPFRTSWKHQPRRIFMLSTTSSQPTPAGAAPLLCKLMPMPLLSSSNPLLGREAESPLLALLKGSSLAVATRVGHLLQRGTLPCPAPLSSRPATGAQLPVSVRLQRSTPQRLHLLGTGRARLGCSLPMRIPGARRTLLQGLQPRSSLLLLPGRPRARLLPSILPPGLLCSLLVPQL